MTEPSHHELFRAVVEYAPEAILIVDAAGKILVVNSSMEALFGYSRDALIGESVEKLVPERFHERHVGYREDFTGNPHARGIEAGKPFAAQHRNGQEFTVEVSLAPLPLDGVTLGMATIREVSASRKYEMAAEKIAALLADAQEMAHVGRFEIDLKSKTRSWSDELWRIVGQDPKNRRPTQELIDSVIHPKDVQLVKDMWGNLERGEAIPNTEYRIVLPTGETRWLRTRAHIETAGRQPTVVGMTMDITDLREAFRRQGETEKSFRSGFDRSPIGMAVCDFEGRLQMANPALCTMLGRELAELVALPNLAEVLSDDDGAFSLEGEGAHSQHLIEHPSGRKVWVDVISTLVKHEDGSSSYYFVQVHDISDQKRDEESLIHQAFHDALTGLPNRLMLMRRLEQSLDRARRSGERTAVMFIDVDQFKPINDTLGHDAGDVLLVLLTQRLSQVVGGSDMLARFGGDEFVVVSDRMTEESVATLAQRITDATREPFALAGRDVWITLSIGTTLATGYENVAGVLRSSDAARYAAEGRQHATSIARSVDLQTSSDRAAALLYALEGALDRGELSLVFQPIVRLEDERPIGFEALLRWNHPEFGVISPLEFIPIAERSRLIVTPIGEWVLHRAIEQVHRWRSELPGWESLMVGVNVSAVQMLDPGFVPVVESIIDEVGIDPSAVVLELTESIVMDDIEKASGGLENLRAVGVGLAIDDFGTGYSSLAYLRDLPVDAIKIDRSFVEPLDGESTSAAPILRAIVGLVEAVGLDSIAEGVETRDQLELLREYGVHSGQGYLWSRPLAPEMVPGWLAAVGSDRASGGQETNA